MVRLIRRQHLLFSAQDPLNVANVHNNGSNSLIHLLLTLIILTHHLGYHLRHLQCLLRTV